MRATISLAALALAIAASACSSDGAATAPPPPPPPSRVDGLWTASGSTSTLFRLAPEQLDGSGDRTPATSITSPSGRFYKLTGLAFDASGTLWAVSEIESRVLGFAPPALASSGSTTATTVLVASDGSLDEPTGLAFDREHRLWVANHRGGTLVRFDPAQLSQGGNPPPAVVISGLDRPTAIAFDAEGSLWVSDNAAHTVSKYTAAQLAASGAPAPAVVLSAVDASLYFPAGIAFDAQGDLWVANSGLGTVVAFTPAQLAASGAPVPHVVLSSAGTALTLPVGLAFDGGGSLWVVSAAGELARFAPASLTTSGAPQPSARLLLGANSLTWGAALWPKPSGLPLN